MKNLHWQLFLSIGLLALSASLYFLHYTIFQDTHHIFVFLLSDIAFIPIEVFLVTLVINQLLTFRERKKIMEKLHILIGVFFSEMGTELCADLSGYDLNVKKIQKQLIIENNWKIEDFSILKNNLFNHNPQIRVSKNQLKKLRTTLASKKAFLLNLMENPNLVEHESFTNLLLSIFHLIEELEHRDNFQHFPKGDSKHLEGDIERVYKNLISEWSNYIEYLKNNYPYLFSLALRTNPFDKNATAVIE